MKHRALFLDRDGVINHDNGYVIKKEDFIFVDGIFELVAKAKALGYLVVVVTNQAGIGRGYYSESDFHELMNWVRSQFKVSLGDLDAVYFCPYHPDYGTGHYRRHSPCRKPAPGMLLTAISEWEIDPSCSVLVGDKVTDIQAGLAAGINTNLLFQPVEDELYQHSICSLSQVLPYLTPKDK